MRGKGNEGYSLVEVLLATAMIAIVLIPVCSIMIFSKQVNNKAEAVLQARLAVSSAVETLMAQGINLDGTEYTFETSDVFEDVQVTVTPLQDANHNALDYCKVVVTDLADDPLVSITTHIRVIPVQNPNEGGNG